MAADSTSPKRATINPVALLAIQLATSPGAYAVFVGSGVSAGSVPSGAELRVATLRILYTAQERVQPPENTDLDAWWQSHSAGAATYSAMLAAAYPRPQERRRYLADLFEGKEPTKAHRLLAAMARRGLIRVFITTNFDRLLERALEEEGMRIASVALGEHVAVAAPREQVDAYVLHLHGDYTTERMRNTDEELEILDVEIETQFADILRTHGLVVLGYAGADAAVARAMRRNPSRYSLFWNVRGKPSGPQLELIGALDGYATASESVEDFLEDLLMRIDAVASQPDGRLPVNQYREVRQLIEEGRTVPVQRRARELGRRLRESVDSWVDANRHTLHFSAAEPLESWAPLYTSLLDGTGAPLRALVAAGSAAVEASSGDLDGFVEELVRLFRVEGTNGLTTVISAPKLVARLGCELLLGCAVALRRWHAFELIAAAKWRERDGSLWPWVFLMEFVYPQALGTDAARAGALTRKVAIEQRDLDDALQIGPEASVKGATDANILLGIAFHAIHEKAVAAGNDRSPLHFWGYRFGPSENLLSDLALRSDALAVLARLASEDPELFRKQFKKSLPGTPQFRW
jgi:hypothetical protein